MLIHSRATITVTKAQLRHANLVAYLNDFNQMLRARSLPKIAAQERIRVIGVLPHHHAKGLRVPTHWRLVLQIGVDERPCLVDLPTAFCRKELGLVIRDRQLVQVKRGDETKSHDLREPIELKMAA